MSLMAYLAVQESASKAESAAAAARAELELFRSGLDSEESGSQKQIRQLGEQLQIAEEEADELRDELSQQARHGTGSDIIYGGHHCALVMLSAASR